MARQCLLAVSLCLGIIALQVQTAATSSPYYIAKKCPFPTVFAGNLAVGELPPMVGIPVNDHNFKAYLAQILCKGMCHNPVTPLTASDDISNMLEVNTRFECQNRDVKIEGGSTEEIHASFNAQVQKPVCEVVDDTIACIVDEFGKTIYVNIHLQPCALDFEIYVVKPTKTFGGLQCNLVGDKHATTVNNVFELDLLSNSKTNAKKKLVFAPEPEAKDIVAYKKLTLDMSAAKDFDDYTNVLGTWKKLCGKTTGHSATTVCQSVTTNMVKVCKQVRAPDANDQIIKIKDCVKQYYVGAQQGAMEAEADPYWCGLKEWSMEAGMQTCVDSNSTPQTPNEGGGSFAFIRSIYDCICAWGESLNPVFGPVSWVWSWFVWGFWNITLYTVPPLWGLQILRGLPYIATVANFIFSIIKTSMEFADGYEGCVHIKDFIGRSVKLLCCILPYMVITFLLSVVNCMMRAVGLNLELINGLRESCNIMQTESVHLVQGLEKCEKLEGQVVDMDQKFASLEAYMQETIRQQTAAGINNSRGNEGMRNRRGRSSDDAKRQGMHV